MAEPTQNRRYTDEHGERIVRLESDMNHVKGSLDTIADSMDKLANAVSDIAKNDFKISILEDFRTRTEAHLKFCDAQHLDTKDKLNNTTEKVNRLYWLAPLALLAIQGIWQLYTFFAK